MKDQWATMKPASKQWVRSIALGMAAAATLPGQLAMASELNIDGKSPKDAAQAIFVHAEKYHRGWESAHSKGRMVLRNAAGKESTVPLESWAIDGEPYKETKKKLDAGATFIRYDSDGTGLVTFMYRNAKDLQWVWVPSLKRKMRINTQGVTGAFVGSEFAIEDLRSQLPEKFKSKLIGEEPCGELTENGEAVELTCWKFTRKPLAKKTGYSRMTTWVDQKHYRVIKTDFFDRNKEPLKTLEARHWELMQDEFWRAKYSDMKNLQTGRSSTLWSDKLELKIDLSKGDFEANRKLLR
mgnify:CR=1 FL=1